MRSIEEIGVPKGEGRDQIKGNVAIIDYEELEKVIELLEDSMKHGETYLSHEEVRFTGHIMANNAREAYETLVEAHPDYELENNE